MPQTPWPVAMKAPGEAYAMPFSGEACLQYAGEIADVLCRCLDARPTAPVVSDITTRVESMDDLLAEIRRQVPESRITPSPRFRPAPEVTRDASPLERLIGAWPRVLLSEGVSRTIAAYRSLKGSGLFLALVGEIES